MFEIFPQFEFDVAGDTAAGTHPTLIDDKLSRWAIVVLNHTHSVPSRASNLPMLSSTRRFPESWVPLTHRCSSGVDAVIRSINKSTL